MSQIQENDKARTKNARKPETRRIKANIVLGEAFEEAKTSTFTPTLSNSNQNTGKKSQVEVADARIIARPLLLPYSRGAPATETEQEEGGDR